MTLDFLRCPETGKRAYRDIYEARMTVAYLMESPHVPPLFPYSCPSCGYLHLTRRRQAEPEPDAEGFASRGCED